MRRRLVIQVVAAIAFFAGLVTAVAPARAVILLQEDFEDGNLTGRGWYDVV